jgi:hypothetical protein
MAGWLSSAPQLRDNDTTEPCVAEFKALLNSAGGTGNYDQLRQTWQECNARAKEEKKKEFARTRNIWAETDLDAAARIPGWDLFPLFPLP